MKKMFDRLGLIAFVRERLSVCCVPVLRVVLLYVLQFGLNRIQALRHAFGRA